jgi:hypothetical protein
MSTATPSSFSGHGLALLLAGAVVAAWVGVMALSLRQASLPADAEGLVLVAFPPGTSDADAFAAVVRAGGEPIRRTWLGFVWVAQGRAGGFVGRLESEGALAAFGEMPLLPVLGGCAVVSVADRRPPGYDGGQRRARPLADP